METGHRRHGETTTTTILLSASSIKLTPNGLHYMHRMSAALNPHQ